MNELTDECVLGDVYARVRRSVRPERTTVVVRRGRP